MAGALTGILGMVGFFLTEAATVSRGFAYALAALALPFMILGAVIRFPLQRAGTYAGYLGAVLIGIIVETHRFLHENQITVSIPVCRNIRMATIIPISFAAVVWFVSVFPEQWSTISGNTEIIMLYTVGLLVLGLAGTVVPLLTDPVYKEYEESKVETEQLRTEATAREEELTSSRDRGEELEAEVEALQAEIDGGQAKCCSLRTVRR